MHRYDWGVQRLLDQHESADARQWLRKAGEPYGVIHELSHAESLELVEAAWAKGALAVSVLGNLDLSRPRNINVDWILIELPNNKSDREALFNFEKVVAAENGFMSSIDEGQRYIALRFT